MKEESTIRFQKRCGLNKQSFHLGGISSVTVPVEINDKRVKAWGQGWT